MLLRDRKCTTSRSGRKDPPPAITPSQVMKRNERPIPFANDPIRGPVLTISKEDIDALSSRDKDLTTALIDYLLQCAIPQDTIPPSTLIGSSNSLSYFEMMNKKAVNSTDLADVQATTILRDKYQMYGLCPHHFIAANCSHKHFYVITVLFPRRKTQKCEKLSCSLLVQLLRKLTTSNAAL
jgi:hypothetical protein